MKRLVVNADDFGFSPNRNRGIRETIEKGIVTSVSLIANFPAVDEAMDWLKGRDIGIAVHLNLSDGVPMTGGPSFPGRDRAHESALHRKHESGFVEKEFRAQIARIVDAGLTITHFDGHHHIHCFPGIAEIVARLAKEYGIGWIRCPVMEEDHVIRSSPERKLILEQYARLGLFARQVFEGMKFTDHFRGAELAHDVTREGVIRILKSLPDGVTEYMTHPGYADDETTFSSSAREAEVRVLTDAGVAAVVDEEGIELTHFGKL